MAVDQVTINGNAFDWGSASILIDGDPLIGITAVNYSDKLERTKQYGSSRSRTPRGRTRGKYSAEGSITVYKDTANALRARLAQKGGGSSFGNATFNITVQYSENGLDFISDQIMQCKIAGDDSKNEENTDPSKEDIALDVMYIVWNGKTLFDSSGGGIAGLISQIGGAIAGALGL